MWLGIVETKCVKAAYEIPYKSTTSQVSLRFHRNVTDVPFTPVRPWGKPACIAVFDEEMWVFAMPSLAGHPAVAIPLDLLESQLLGHEKNTFSGAIHPASP